MSSSKLWHRNLRGLFTKGASRCINSSMVTEVSDISLLEWCLFFKRGCLILYNGTVWHGYIDLCEVSILWMTSLSKRGVSSCKLSWLQTSLLSHYKRMSCPKSKIDG
ncbi:hypothetical protein FKM82_026860 [Ascaphus truei]